MKHAALVKLSIQTVASTYMNQNLNIHIVLSVTLRRYEHACDDKRMLWANVGPWTSLWLSQASFYEIQRCFTHICLCECDEKCFLCIATGGDCSSEVAWMHPDFINSTSDLNASQKLLITPWGFISMRHGLKGSKCLHKIFKSASVADALEYLRWFFYSSRSWCSSNKSATSKCKTGRGLKSQLLRRLRSFFCVLEDTVM